MLRWVLLMEQAVAIQLLVIQTIASTEEISQELLGQARTVFQVGLPMRAHFLKCQTLN